MTRAAFVLPLLLAACSGGSSTTSNIAAAGGGIAGGTLTANPAVAIGVGWISVRKRPRGSTGTGSR